MTTNQVQKEVKTILCELETEKHVFLNNYSATIKLVKKRIEKFTGVPYDNNGVYLRFCVEELVRSKCEAPDTVYTIGFDVSDFKPVPAKCWEEQLCNDICEKLGMYSWNYKTWNGVKQRFLSISGAGQYIGNSDTFVLESKEVGKLNYGKQIVRKKLPGICTGYVGIEGLIEELEKNNRVAVPFMCFYDSRSGITKTKFNSCYVVIEKKINKVEQYPSCTFWDVKKSCWELYKKMEK